MKKNDYRVGDRVVIRPDIKEGHLLLSPEILKLKWLTVSLAEAGYCEFSEVDNEYVSFGYDVIQRHYFEPGEDIWVWDRGENPLKLKYVGYANGVEYPYLARKEDKHNGWIAYKYATPIREEEEYKQELQNTPMPPDHPFLKEAVKKVSKPTIDDWTKAFNTMDEGLNHDENNSNHPDELDKRLRSQAKRISCNGDQIDALAGKYDDVLDEKNATIKGLITAMGEDYKKTKEMVDAYNTNTEKLEKKLDGAEKKKEETFAALIGRVYKLEQSKANESRRCEDCMAKHSKRIYDLEQAQGKTPTYGPISPTQAPVDLDTLTHEYNGGCCEDDENEKTKRKGGE